MIRASSGKDASDPTAAHVAILLATLNGERFIGEQLQSLQSQTVGPLDLWVSDDGSGDATPGILSDWQSKWTRGGFTILPGPGLGVSENFRSLMCLPTISADYVALCDQDDVWLPDKLARAVAALSAAPATHPSIYFSRTRLVDDSARPIGHSPLFRRATGFRNAIVQSIGGANTLVLNRAAFELVRISAMRTPFVLPDWWCYMLVSGAGGSVVYDVEARLNYRQHERNTVGANQGLIASSKRFRQLLAGRFAAWNKMNLDGLERCADLLDEDAREVAAQFREIRASRYFRAVARLRRSEIYRQTLTGNLGLIFAAFIGRL